MFLLAACSFRTQEQGHLGTTWLIYLLCILSQEDADISKVRWGGKKSHEAGCQLKPSHSQFSRRIRNSQRRRRKGAGTGKETKHIYFYILEGCCVEGQVWLPEAWSGACWGFLKLKIALIKAPKPDEPHPKLAH